jgi:rod shape determining protein RodA
MAVDPVADSCSVLGSFGGGADAGSIGAFSLQPSELVKVTLLLVLARFYHRHVPMDGYRLRDLVIPTLLAVLPAALVLAEPNLGTAVILGLLFMTLTCASGIRVGSLALVLIAGEACCPSYGNT